MCGAEEECWVYKCRYIYLKMLLIFTKKTTYTIEKAIFTHFSYRKLFYEKQTSLIFAFKDEILSTVKKGFAINLLHITLIP